MAHFAKLDENNIVVEVLTVANEVLQVNGQESEQAGIDFLTELTGYSNWVQTSYNNTFRFNYAGIGFSFDKNRNAFIPKQPYPSWILQESTCTWTAPIPYPTDGNDYQWFEEGKQWVQVNEPA